MNAQHLQTVTTEFTSQATIWSGSVPSSLIDLVSGLELRPEDNVIDVAAGSCRVSRAVAPLVSEVAAVEITQAMLEQGRNAAAKEGISNISFHLGAAESLPFEPNMFDVAITRYSFHHFVDAKQVLDEMIRVTKPRGRVIVIDILSPEDVQVAQQYNHYQRLRDPSHTQSPTLSELRKWYRQEELTITRCQTTDESQELEGWLNLPALSETDKDEIRTAVGAELNGGLATGLHPFDDQGIIRFRERCVTVIGKKNR